MSDMIRNLEEGFSCDMDLFHHHRLQMREQMGRRKRRKFRENSATSSRSGRNRKWGLIPIMWRKLLKDNIMLTFDTLRNDIEIMMLYLRCIMRKPVFSSPESEDKQDEFLV